MTSTIIVAAGHGSRFGGDIPKQFVELGGMPVIARCMATFEATIPGNEIIVVASQSYLETVNRIGLDYRISQMSQVVEGGETRAQSVRNGFAAIDKRSKIVIIHDAARPFVHVNEIDAVVEAAETSGASCLVTEVTDTVKEVSENTIVGTVDRSRLRRALTPQAFRVGILRQALDGYFDPSATDECSIVERMGFPITCVEGSSRNIKITREEDLVVAEAMLAKYSNYGLIGCYE